MHVLRWVVGLSVFLVFAYWNISKVHFWNFLPSNSILTADNDLPSITMHVLRWVVPISVFLVLAVFPVYVEQIHT